MGGKLGASADTGAESTDTHTDTHTETATATDTDTATNTETDETTAHASTDPHTDPPTHDRLSSIRLEGLSNFSSGLFVLDVAHLPTGCGSWPAFWLTAEGGWPMHGEIDILESINRQSTAKTALHTSGNCSMQRVPDDAKSGTWDEAFGVPDSITGEPKQTHVQARNCYVWAPGQWANQGCVTVGQKGTLGTP
ncbi:hypothetical protein B484DRAFT_414706, partial [Ochromonadaceae sp. CCMP2298]